MFLSSGDLVYLDKEYYREMVTRVMRTIHVEIRLKLNSERKGMADVIGCLPTFTLKTYFFIVIADLPTEHPVLHNNVIMLTEYIWSHIRKSRLTHHNLIGRTTPGEHIQRPLRKGEDSA